MNYKLVFRLLGRLLLMEAALMLPSMGVSLIFRQGDTLAFLEAIAITATVGVMLTFLLKPDRDDLTARDGMAVAGLSWVILSFFGALPFVLSGAIPHVVDAFFEAVSGFTTTGSTILTEIEHLPRGVLFWRSFTHWIGGMGVLVFTLAVLPRLSGRTSHLARAESPGPTFSKLLPKMGDTAKILYVLYFILSFTETVSLLLAGMNLYDALIHTFGTAGTGGFSNYNSSVGAFHSPAIEWIIGVFMMLFGVNFAIYFHLMRREKEPILQSEELWTYLSIVAAATLLVTLSILPRYNGFFEALRYAFFQVTSIISTTGFGTADFNVWPLFSRSMLLLLMCIRASFLTFYLGVGTSWQPTVVCKAVLRALGRMPDPGPGPGPLRCARVRVLALSAQPALREDTSCDCVTARCRVDAGPGAGPRAFAGAGVQVLLVLTLLSVS